MKRVIRILLFTLCSVVNINSFSMENLSLASNEKFSKDERKTSEDDKESLETSQPSKPSGNNLFPYHSYTFLPPYLFFPKPTSQNKSSSSLCNRNNEPSSDATSTPHLYSLNLTTELIKEALEDCPEEIHEVIATINAFKKIDDLNEEDMPRKLLLVGPAGTGKTTLAGVIAKQCSMKSYLYKASLIADRYKNSGDKNIETIFLSLIELNEPCVVIIDELHDLIKKDEDNKNSDTSMIRSLWSLLDECEKGQILFIGLLNYVDKLPEPFISRQEELVKIDLPDKQRREKNIKFFLSRQQNTYFNAIKPSLLAAKTNDYSTRDIYKLLRKALRKAIRRDDAHILVTMEDCLHASYAIKAWDEKISDPAKNSWTSLLKKHAPTIGHYAFQIGFEAARMLAQHKLNQMLNAKPLALQEESAKEQYKMNLFTREAAIENAPWDMYTDCPKNKLRRMANAIWK